MEDQRPLKVANRIITVHPQNHHSSEVELLCVDVDFLFDVVLHIGVAMSETFLIFVAESHMKTP